MSELDTILKEADKAFAKLAKAQRDVLAAEAEVNSLRARYGTATGTFGLRPEAFRHAVEARFGKRAA